MRGTPHPSRLGLAITSAAVCALFPGSGPGITGRFAMRPEDTNGERHEPGSNSIRVAGSQIDGWMFYDHASAATPLPISVLEDQSRDVHPTLVLPYSDEGKPHRRS